MAKYDKAGYILIHKDEPELLPNPWEWGSRKKRGLLRRLINWLTGRSPYNH